MSGSQKPLYVAYYTKETGYAQEAEELRATLEQFHLDHEILGVPNLGSWQQNTHYKARFLKEQLNAHPDRPLVYLDVDARVRQYPELFDRLSCDMAGYHYLNKVTKRPELLSGTLYFEPTAATKKLIDTWIFANETLPARWEQKNLEIALKKVPEITFYELPAPYVLIFDLMQDLGPPVIEHLQASRRLKKTVNTKSS